MPMNRRIPALTMSIILTATFRSPPMSFRTIAGVN